MKMTTLFTLDGKQYASDPGLKIILSPALKLRKMMRTLKV